MAINDNVQFRLTAKTATDLNINHLEDPISQDRPFYDDWLVDLIRIRRRKVAVFMHITTRIALAMPIYEIGGIKELFYTFPILLEWFINDLCIDCYEGFGTKIKKYFEPDKKSFLFCKTNDRSVLAHMNQFKLLLEMKAVQHDNINQVLCDQSAESWQTHLISNPHRIKEWTRPCELWHSHLLAYVKNDIMLD